MGLIDRLIDKLFDSAISAKRDATVAKVVNDNPELKKLINQHKSNRSNAKKILARIAKERGLDITK